jgi:ankyrin repeat protein
MFIHALLIGVSLLQQKPDVNAPEGDGMTALHWAAVRDDSQLASLLLSRGADVEARTRHNALTPIFLASGNGGVATLRLLLKAGADPNSVNGNGTTALMTAASSGNPESVQLLLDHGANVHAKETVRGQTALMFAAALNRDEVIRLLVARGADPNITTVVRETERIRFDQYGRVHYVRPGAAVKIEQTNEVNETAKAAAAVAVAETKSNLDLLARALGLQSANMLLGKPRGQGPLLMTPPLRVGPEFVGGMTALLYAAREGHMEAARALVEAGADINKISGDKFSPLVMAIANGHLDLAMYLLNHGADPNLTTQAGLAALYATIDVRWAPAAAFPQPSTEQENVSYLDLMKALLEKGAQVNAPVGEKPWFRSLFSDPTWLDLAGATPLWRAAQSSDIAAIRLLMSYGADPKLATKSGVTPLMAAAGVGWAANWSVNAPVPAIEAVAYLAEAGNDVNAVDARGYTALHGAGYIGNNDIVRYLAGKGAKTDVRSKTGDSPADMANGPWRFGQPHPETVALLEELGSPNSHNCRSDQCVVAATPLSAAEQAEKQALDVFAAALGFESTVYRIDVP